MKEKQEEVNEEEAKERETLEVRKRRQRFHF
jgi:hypothetical protein